MTWFRLAVRGDQATTAAACPVVYVQPEASVLEQRLAEVNPDELTPKAALELLYELKALLGQ